MLLSDAFEASLVNLQKRKILTEIRPESLPNQVLRLGPISSLNLCVLSCCDGHQFMDITRHTFACCEAVKDSAKKKMELASLGEDCIHWRTENGGPFVLSVPDLMNRSYNGAIDHVDRNALASLHEGMSLKHINVVLLLGHSVCGKMKPHVDSFEKYAYYMAKAKRRIMEEFDLPTEQVLAQLQCHRTVGRRTYHVDYSEASVLSLAA